MQKSWEMPPEGLQWIRYGLPSVFYEAIVMKITPEKVAIGLLFPFYLALIGLIGLMVIAEDIRAAPVRGETE